METGKWNLEAISRYGIMRLGMLILEHIRPPFKIVKLEGDAIAYYVPVEMLPEAERVPL
jgi:hypothetical protein